MRTRRLAGLIALGIVLLLPSAIVAGPHTMLGSLKIEAADASDLTDKLVGFAVIANPGLEKTITQQIPGFTLPVLVDGDRADGPGRRPFLNRRLDTTVVLTNTNATGDGTLNIVLKLRNANGVLLATQAHALAQDATVVVHISAIVP